MSSRLQIGVIGKNPEMIDLVVAEFIFAGFNPAISEEDSEDSIGEENIAIKGLKELAKTAEKLKLPSADVVRNLINNYGVDNLVIPGPRNIIVARGLRAAGLKYVAVSEYGESELSGAAPYDERADDPGLLMSIADYKINPGKKGADLRNSVQQTASSLLLE
jgi:hypothetical protein